MYFKATIPHAGPTAFEILELQKAVTGACVPFLLGHNCNTSSSVHKTCNKISLVNFHLHTSLVTTIRVQQKTLKIIEIQFRVIAW